MDYNGRKATDIWCLHSINVFCSLECLSTNGDIPFCLCEATQKRYRSTGPTPTV